MRRPPTALAALGRTVIEAATHMSLPVEPLLQGSGLTRAALDEVDGRIETDKLFRLWNLAAEASSDGYFGLHIGERVVSAATIHVVGYIARNSRTLGDCYARTETFARLTNEASEITLRVEGPEAVMRVGPAPGTEEWPRCYAEMAICAYLSLGRRWTGADVRPVRAEFRHDAPPDIGEYHRIFGERLKFGAPQNALVLPRAALDLPLVDPDPSLSAYLDLRAKVLLEAVSKGSAFETEVRTRIDEELVSGAPALPSVARRLGMSARTLQRRLAEEGLSFTELVDDVRRAAALGLIGDRRLSIFEIAAMIGYQDAQSFRAAFQRWTGKTPRDYRQKGR